MGYWSGRFQGPKIMQAIAIPIGYLSELDRESVLIKTSHSLVIRQREIKLETSPLLPNSYSAGRYYAGHSMRKVINNPTHGGLHLPGIRCLLVQKKLESYRGTNN